MLDDELERHDAEVSQLVASMTESIDRWLELKERTRKVRLSITSPVDERINDWAVYKEMKAEGAGLPEEWGGGSFVTGNKKHKKAENGLVMRPATDSPRK